MAGVHRRLKEAWIGYPLDEVLIISVSGQDPGWFLSVYDKNEIELLNPIRMVEKVIRCQVQISNDLISSTVIIHGDVQRE
jgi:hypothetical protein